MTTDLHKTSINRVLKPLASNCVAHAYNPRTWRLKQKDPDFKAKIGYLERPGGKKK